MSYNSTEVNGGFCQTTDAPSRKLTIVPAEMLSENELKWLKPIDSVRKVAFDELVERVLRGDWMVWRIEPPGEGVIVGFGWEEPKGLFIYYLHGRGFLDNVKGEDLLAASRAVGFSRILCETTSLARVRLFWRLGFRVWKYNAHGYCLELKDG